MDQIATTAEPLLDRSQSPPDKSGSELAQTGCRGFGTDLCLRCVLHCVDYHGRQGTALKTGLTSVLHRVA
jgi:hypothetical protein